MGCCFCCQKHNVNEVDEYNCLQKKLLYEDYQPPISIPQMNRPSVYQEYDSQEIYKHLNQYAYQSEQQPWQDSSMTENLYQIGDGCDDEYLVKFTTLNEKIMDTNKEYFGGSVSNQ